MQPSSRHSVLSSAASVAPLALGGAPAAGATVRAVGYGITQAATSGTSGTRMTKSQPVNAVTTHEFTVGPNFTCHGDSGGPVFNASGAVVGTTSYGDTANCQGIDHFARVDDNRAWIDSMVSTFGGASSGGGGSGSGGGGGTTTTCSTQIETNGLTKKVSCSNGTCQCSLNGTNLNSCTENASGCSIPGSCCGF